MSLNRAIALLLIVLSLVAVIFGVRRQQESLELSSTFAMHSGTASLELVVLDGPIFPTYEALQGPLTVRDRLLELAQEEQSDIKGVLLAINSPGGTVGLSAELYDAVRRLRAQKPVVVTVMDVAASGGYYVASAADKIYANPGSVLGSIGVIGSGLNLTGLLERLGVSDQTYKTGPYKDTGSPFRKETEDERRIVQAEIQDMYQQFVSDVAKGRGLDVEAVRKLADGRTYTGRQSLTNKLVDALGPAEDALQELRKLARQNSICRKRKLCR
ncbi:MAG: signal peptide peptidase SppA [Oscillatoriales cyanobacterium SM2_1_8]|nr:signal peptide peptidase SppA [Oscillatoriales cyanobacterium SM2_1_8]